MGVAAQREPQSPFSHLLQGLFQASPRVAQQCDLSTAPLMLTSQRLLIIFSQQVLLIVSAVCFKHFKLRFLSN